MEGNFILVLVSRCRREVYFRTTKESTDATLSIHRAIGSMIDEFLYTDHGWKFKLPYGDRNRNSQRYPPARSFSRLF